jgi:hypothetical protein
VLTFADSHAARLRGALQVDYSFWTSTLCSQMIFMQDGCVSNLYDEFVSAGTLVAAWKGVIG